MCIETGSSTEVRPYMAGKTGSNAQCWYWREIQAGAGVLLDVRLEERSSLGSSIGLHRTCNEKKRISIKRGALKRFLNG